MEKGQKNDKLNECEEKDKVQLSPWLLVGSFMTNGSVDDYRHSQIVMSGRSQCWQWHACAIACMYCTCANAECACLPCLRTLKALLLDWLGIGTCIYHSFTSILVGPRDLHSPFKYTNAMYVCTFFQYSLFDRMRYNKYKIVTIF